MPRHTADRLAPRPHLHHPPVGPGPRRAPLLLPRDGGQLRPRRAAAVPRLLQRRQLRGRAGGGVPRGARPGPVPGGLHHLLGYKHRHLVPHNWKSFNSTYSSFFLWITILFTIYYILCKGSCKVDTVNRKWSFASFNLFLYIFP